MSSDSYVRKKSDVELYPFSFRCFLLPSWRLSVLARETRFLEDVVLFRLPAADRIERNRIDPRVFVSLLLLLSARLGGVVADLEFTTLPERPLW